MKGQISTLLRSFAVQGSFNYERMSGIGLSFIMRPLLRNLPADRQAEAGRRSAAYFNCHPYLAGLAATSLVRAEMDGASHDDLERFKKALIGPLGLIGDRFIWAGLLPSIAASGLIMVASGAELVAVATFLIVFNVVQVMIRWSGIRLGAERGIGVGATLAHRSVKRTMAVVDAFAAFMIGLAVPIVGGWLTANWRHADLGGILLVALLGVVFSRGIFKRLDSLRFGMVALAVAVLVGMVVS